MKRIVLMVALAGILVTTACGGGGSGSSAPPLQSNPDFSVAVSAPISVERGASGNATVAVNPLHGFDGTVSVSFAVSQSGITASPIQVPAGQTGTLAVAVASSVPAGTYTGTVTGTSGSLSHNASLQVTVTAPAITVTVSPLSTTVEQGNQVQFTAAVTGTANTAVTWSVAGGTQNGTVSASGLYTAPPTAPNPATVSVVATSAADPTKSGSASVTVLWHVGNGAFTGLQFGSGVSADVQAYITNHFNAAYPAAIKILGLPPDTSVLTVDVGCGSNSYNEYTHAICMLVPPNLPGPDYSWNQLFDHELSHAMVSPKAARIGPLWFREAFANMGSKLLDRMLGNPNVVNELDYDILQLGGKEYVGGIEGNSWRSGDAAYVNRESGANLFQFLLATQAPTAQVGDFENYAALKNLRAALYDILNRKQQALSQSDVFDAVRTTFSQPIEGVLPDQWMAAQAVAYTYGQPGVYLFVHASPAATAYYGIGNNAFLEIGCFQRTIQEGLPIPVETGCTSGSVTISISNAASTVYSSTFDLSNAKHELALDVSAYPFGAYRVTASGTANGVPVTSNDDYFGVFDQSVAPSGHTIGALGSVLFLLVRNADGTPSKNPVPAPANGPAGAFVGPNQNGAAIWQIDTTKALTIPQPEYDWLGRRLPVPLPFSPVYIGVNP